MYFLGSLVELHQIASNQIRVHMCSALQKYPKLLTYRAYPNTSYQALPTYPAYTLTKPFLQDISLPLPHVLRSYPLTIPYPGTKHYPRTVLHPNTVPILIPFPNIRPYPRTLPYSRTLPYPRYLSFPSTLPCPCTLPYLCNLNCLRTLPCPRNPAQPTFSVLPT